MPSRPSSARPTPLLHRSPSLASPPLAPGNLDNATRKLRWDDAHAPEEQGSGDGQAAAAAQEQAQVEEDEPDAVEGGVLAITAAKGRLGCCFYDPVTGKLSIFEN
ncbi:hypothetical protein JCM9279_005722 [Rhodotorula babjevae]